MAKIAGGGGVRRRGPIGVAGWILVKGEVWFNIILITKLTSSDIYRFYVHDAYCRQGANLTLIYNTRFTCLHVGLLITRSLDITQSNKTERVNPPAEIQFMMAHGTRLTMDFTLQNVCRLCAQLAMIRPTAELNYHSRRCKKYNKSTSCMVPSQFTRLMTIT